MEVADPLLGQVLHPAAPFRFDGVTPRQMVAGRASRAGAHNEKVFAALARGETAPLSA